MGVPGLQGKGRIWRRTLQSKHAVPSCSQTVSPKLPPGEYKRVVSDSIPPLPCHLSYLINMHYQSSNCFQTFCLTNRQAEGQNPYCGLLWRCFWTFGGYWLIRVISVELVVPRRAGLVLRWVTVCGYYTPSWHLESSHPGHRCNKRFFAFFIQVTFFYVC